MIQKRAEVSALLPFELKILIDLEADDDWDPLDEINEDDTSDNQLRY